MSGLRPVSFRKERGHEPRLSAPYVPGKRHERYWTEAEDAIIRKYYPDGGLAACAAHLPPHRRYRETLSATAVGRILGIDAKTVTREILQGDLKAEKRETQRRIQQGGDPWSITPANLRRYILDNLARIDLRKVDKFAFVQIVAAEALEQSKEAA